MPDSADGEGVFADGDRLVVRNDLGFGKKLRLDGFLSPVLAAGTDAVTVDLSEVRHLCSSNLAVLASACATVSSKGKQVTIRARSDVARVLRMGGIERVARLEELPEP